VKEEIELADVDVRSPQGKGGSGGARGLDHEIPLGRESDLQGGPATGTGKQDGNRPNQIQGSPTFLALLDL
jgi:hypothetical protein